MHGVRTQNLISGQSRVRSEIKRSIVHSELILYNTIFISRTLHGELKDIKLGFPY
jgi:hypothetical protein